MDVYGVADQYAVQRPVQQSVQQASGAVVTAALPPGYVSPVGQAVPAQFAVQQPASQDVAYSDVSPIDETSIEQFFEQEGELTDSNLTPIMEPLVGPGTIQSPMPVFATAATQPKAAAEEGATMESFFKDSGEVSLDIASDQEDIEV